jgi:hypothetical protein
MRILGMHASFGSFSRHPPLRVLHAPHGTRVPSRKTQGNLTHCNKKQFCGFERGSFVLVHDRARDSPLPPPPPPTRTGRTTDAVVPAVTNKSCSCGARPPGHYPNCVRLTAGGLGGFAAHAPASRWFCLVLSSFLLDFATWTPVDVVFCCEVWGAKVFDFLEQR